MTSQAFGPFVQLDRMDGVATLRLARPERGNALGVEIVEGLMAGLDAALTAAGTHVVVLRAEGPHFCTGLDLEGLESLSDGDLLHRLVRIETLLSALWHSPCRTVAVAQGRCWGAGADLFAVCDARLALPQADFRFPGAGFGLVLGTRRLAQRVGEQRARALTADGQSLRAEQALEAGLASLVGTGIPDDWLAVPAADPPTVAALRAATRPDQRDQDLAALVRSAARPGLRERIQAYRERVRSAARPARSAVPRPD